MIADRDSLLGYFYAPTPYAVNYQFVGIHGPKQWSGYRLSNEVIEWIKTQTEDQYFAFKDLNNIDFLYFMSPELEVWMKLKFSESLH